MMRLPPQSMLFYPNQLQIVSYDLHMEDLHENQNILLLLHRSQTSPIMRCGNMR